MAEITSIVQQKKDKERVSVYVDGRFYCGMMLETVIRCRLKEGMQIDCERLDEIQFENEKSQALDKAITHLSATMKTQKQMRDFLKKKGYADAVCEYVLEKLREYRFVDDREYCTQFVETAGKNYGSLRIAQELKKRGAQEEDIDAALSERTGESEAVEKAVRKYMKNKEFTRENLSKAFRNLLSKGFDYETAKEALASLGADEED